jgi:hypothetical protein
MSYRSITLKLDGLCSHASEEDCEFLGMMPDECFSMDGYPQAMVVLFRCSRSQGFKKTVVSDFCSLLQLVSRQQARVSISLKC